MIVRCEGQHAGDEPQNVIRFARPEKRAMPTVVKNDEDPNQKRSRQDRQRHGDPLGHPKSEVHHIPQCGVRNERVNDLPDTSSDRWPLVPNDNFFPCRGLCRALILASSIGNMPTTLFFKSRQVFRFYSRHCRGSCLSLAIG